MKSAHIYWYTSTFEQIYMHCKNVRFIQCLLTEDVQKTLKLKFLGVLYLSDFGQGIEPL